MFQASTKVSSTSDTTPARLRGSRMRNKIVRSPAPSMRAASSSSSGQVSNTWRSKNTPNGENTAGMMSAAHEPISPRPRMTK